MTSTFTYNDLGDRVKQAINSLVTTYTLDLNAGLTQVLADKTNRYVYGLGRVSEQSAAGTDYFLPDALGSVRQLANVSTTVTLARNYDPYGNVLSSAGYRSTSYNFTGELRDSGTGLLYTSALVTMQTA